MEPYRPIACGVYDQLEALATLRRAGEIRYRDGEGEERVARGRIRDLFARAGAEFLRLEDGQEIRLDRIVAIDGEPVGPACEMR